MNIGILGQILEKFKDIINIISSARPAVMTRGKIKGHIINIA